MSSSRRAIAPEVGDGAGSVMAHAAGGRFPAPRAVTLVARGIMAGGTVTAVEEKPATAMATLGAALVHAKVTAAGWGPANTTESS